MSTRELVPAAPLKAVIQHDAQLELARSWHQPGTYQNGVTPLAERIGIDARILTRVLGQEAVTLDLADHYCCAAGHQLAEVYPAAYDDYDASYTSYCGTCRSDVDMDILREGKRRLHVRCRDCGTGLYVQFYSQVGKPSTNRRRDIDAQLPRILSLYRAGHSLRAIGAAVGANESLILSRLRNAGVPRRDRVCAIRERDDARRKGKQTRLRQGAATTRRVLELRSTGLTYADIAQALGISQTGASAAAARASKYQEAAP